MTRRGGKVAQPEIIATPYYVLLLFDDGTIHAAGASARFPDVHRAHAYIREGVGRGGRLVAFDQYIDGGWQSRLATDPDVPTGQGGIDFNEPF